MHSLATIVRWPRAFALLFLFSFVAAPCAPLMAQDEAEEDAPAPELIRSPIGTVVLSSVDQLRNELKHVFELSGQMQVYEAMEGAMKSAGDLKGMDQTKPLGAMLFLRNGFPPTPEVIGFVPVEKIEDLTKTIEMGPVVTKKVGDGHYEIIGIRGEFQVKLENGYAYIMRNKELMENQFPNPARIMRGLTSKFDFAISLNLDSVPPAMRKLALGFISAQANADLQQRDDEPDGVYKMRRAQQERGLEAITQILEQLERLVIGIDVDKENSQAALEIVFDAQEDSQLAKDMKQVNKKRSHFERLVQEEAPLSFSMSAPIIERDQQQYREMLDGLELWLPTVLNKGSDETTLNPAITAGIQALRDTVAEAHTDMFLQFYGAPGSFSIVGGGRVVGGQKINAGVKEVLMQFSDDINNEVGEIDFDHETYKDVVFHRMVARDADDAARVFGDEIGIYLGVGRRTAWLAVGGSDALDKTKELIDLLAEPKDGNRTRVRRGPFQLVVNAKQWLGLDDDGEGVQFDAFEDGGDRMTIDIRPTESGMRVRAQVDEGYLRLIGMAAGQRYDRRNERRARRGNRGGQPSGSRD